MCQKAARIAELERQRGMYEMDAANAAIISDIDAELARLRNESPALSHGEGSEPVGWTRDRILRVLRDEARKRQVSHLALGSTADILWKAIFASPPPLPAGNADPRVARMAAHCCVPEIDEPFFVLLGRDPQAPGLVEKWAQDRAQVEPGDKAVSAYATAKFMRMWKEAHPERGLSMEAFAKIGANADPRVREALENAFELACKAACDSCARGYPIDDGDDGVSTRNGRYHPDRNYSNTGFGGGFHECKAADARVAFKAALSALASPQSQGLVDALEAVKRTLAAYQKQGAPHAFVGDISLQKVHTLIDAALAFLRSRASGRSA